MGADQQTIALENRPREELRPGRAAERRNRLKLVGVIVGVVVIFVGLQIPALMHPHQAGYEFKAPPGQFTPVNWSVVEQAQWVYGHPPVFPDNMPDLNGKQVVAEGFLLPLHNPGVASQFFVSDKPRGCYFCNPPGVAEVIQVNLAGGKQLNPVSGMVFCYGTLRVATGAKTDQVLYWMDNAVVVVK